MENILQKGRNGGVSIEIKNTQVFGWEAAIRGSRNPMNSWEKSDSWFLDRYDNDASEWDAHSFSLPAVYIKDDLSEKTIEVRWYPILENGKLDRQSIILNGEIDDRFTFSPCIIGPADHKLLMNLCKDGTEESKWRRMVHVSMDITAPLYWWKEFETYKVGTVSNSCSTMHKIHAKEFTLDDFSCEHLISGSEFGNTPDELWQAGAFRVEHDYDPYALDAEGIEGWYEAKYAKDILLETIDALNVYREKFLETKDDNLNINGTVFMKGDRKKYWWQMIQLLPSSYNQRRTIDLNYEVLASQYRQRKDHKLDCWHQYCDWIRSLPYSEFITMEE